MSCFLGAKEIINIMVNFCEFLPSFLRDSEVARERLLGDLGIDLCICICVCVESSVYWCLKGAKLSLLELVASTEASLLQ